MRILLINHYAGSVEMGMEFRPYYFAREWVKMGHQVRIIAADYSHLRLQNPEIERDFEIEQIEGIEYQWVHTHRYSGNGAQRAMTMAQFVGKLYLHAGKLAREFKPDVVITSSTYPLDTYAGQRIAKKSGAKLVHEVHDMWPLSPMEVGGMPKHHPFIVAMQMGENSFCRHSDAVVSLLPAAKDYFVKHGMAPEKFYHMPNGIDLAEWQGEKPLPVSHQEVLTKLHEQEKFLICFVGSHLSIYGLSDLIEAAKQANNPKLHLVFVGAGNDKPQFMEEAHRTIPDQATFLDPIPKATIPSLLAQVDAIFVGARKNKLMQYGICMNKMFDAMMSAKPILFAVDAPNNYIEEYQCGLSVPFGDITGLSTAIQVLSEKSLEEREEMGARGRGAVLENFNCEPQKHWKHWAFWVSFCLLITI